MVLLYQLSLGIARLDLLEMQDIYGKFRLRIMDNNRGKVKNMV